MNGYSGSSSPRSPFANGSPAAGGALAGGGKGRERIGVVLHEGVLRDPQDGDVVRVASGEVAVVEWEFSNHAPFVRMFELEVEGLPAPDWIAPGSLLSLTLPANGGGLLRLEIQPPPESPEDLLDLKARIQSDGQLIHATVLHLDVFIPNEATAEAAATADASTSLEQAPGQTVFDGQIAPEASTRTSTGRAGTSPARPRRSELGDELMPLVELRERHTDHEEHAVQNTEFHEANALEPPAGALLALRPGETLLLRFAFLNESERARTYVLEDDRSLDVEWLTMVQDEVNISRDQSDELSMRLHPPPAARPGDYPFSVRLGPEGGTLLGRELTLRILAAPAVALKCAAPRLVVGPFKRRIDFALSVETAGNADTAFRLSTHTPLVEYKGRTWRRRDRQAERDAQNPERREGQVLAAVKKTEKPVDIEPEDSPEVLEARTARRAIYESRRWSYAFDHELDSLESLSANRPPKARPIRLRLTRKSLWWWGFRESERVRVQVVPVTDEDNGGREGNALEVEAVRWRPWPVPLRLLLPFGVLPLLLLTGGPSNVMVDNPAYVSDSDTHWIVGELNAGKVATQVRWQAPLLSLITVSGTGEDPIATRWARSPQTIDATFPAGKRSAFNVYKVDRLIGGGAEEVKARFVAARDDTPLFVTDVENSTLKGGKLPDLNRPGTNLPGEVLEVNVPTTGPYILQLSNLAEEDLALNYWVAKRPGGAFIVDDLNSEGSLRSSKLFGLSADPRGKKSTGSPPDTKVVRNDPRAGLSVVQRIKLWRGRGSNIGDKDELVLITTDKYRPVLHIKLTLTAERRDRNGRLIGSAGAVAPGSIGFDRATSERAVVRVLNSTPGSAIGIASDTTPPPNLAAPTTGNAAENGRDGAGSGGESDAPVAP